MRVLSCVFVAALSACSAVPTVQYSKVTAPGDLNGDEIDSFSLRSSTIGIEAAAPSNAASGASVDNYTITSTPSEFLDFKVAIRKADSWGLKTNLTLTKIPNTALIQEIGVDVTDSRADDITKYGGALVKLVGLLKFSAAGELDEKTLPRKIDAAVVLKSANVLRGGSDPIAAGGGVSIKFGPVPVDALEVEKFAFPTVRSGVMYPACRTATVSFTHNANNYERDVVVSDPRYLAYVGFPKNGKVTFHSECGVSITASKDANSGAGIAIADALATQGKAIKDAIDAAKK